MKTKFIYAISLLLIASIFTSCDNLLDEVDQQGATSEENFYKTDEDTKEAIAAVYGQWRSIYFVDFFLKNLLSDDMIAGGGSRGDQTPYEEVNEYTFSSQNGLISEYFVALYKIIYRSNLVINNISVDSDVKKLAVAEAKVARAWSYFNLVTLWGPVPLVTNQLDPSEYQQPNGDVASIWATIEADYRDAIEANILPEKSSPTDKTPGARVTKQAVQAFWGKALLFQKKYGEAATILKSVVNTNLYGLINDYENVLRTVEDFSSENIFEFNFVNDANNPWSQGMAGFANFFGWRADKLDLSGYDFGAHDLYPNGWGLGSPTKDLYDAFVAEEGVDGYRLNASVLPYEKVMEIGAPSHPVKINTGSTLYGNEGYFSWKWRFIGSEVIANSGGYCIDANYRVMRYSEVLLLAAEACLETGDASSALSYVNEVRERAHLDNLSSVTLDDIKTEKRLELCLEGSRFQDLVRWGDAATELAEQGAKVPSFTGLNDDGSYNVSYPYTNSTYGFKTGKHELLPIPEQEILVNSNIIQNPGY